MSESLDERTWRARRAAHEARVDSWIQPHLERRRTGAAHPVHDFMFTYYSHRPAALRRWSPGLGVSLLGDVADFSSLKGYVVEADRARLDHDQAAAQADRVWWIRDFLVAVAGRTPALGCFGMHEWAMVYRQPASALRHSAYPLRLGPQETDAVVEANRVACTHFDAFRFFTEDARPRNAVQPTRDTQLRNDQPGCLHVTMDLYKWAYKVSPWVPSELVADCFELARDVRELDMAAAPYDLRSLGVRPVRVEGVEGKREYAAAQRRFAERAAPLRTRLVEACEQILRLTPSPALSQSR